MATALHCALRRACPRVCAVLRAPTGLPNTPFLEILSITSSLDLEASLMSFGHALLLERTSQQLHILHGLEAKGIYLRARIQSARLTDLPVCSIGDMQPHRYDIGQHKGQTLLPSPLT